MIKVRTLEIINAANPQAGQDLAPLASLARVSSAEAAWRVAYVVEALENVVRHYHAMRDRLAQKYGTLDEGGRSYTFEGPAQQQFADRLDALLAYELELDIERLPAAYADEAGLPAADRLALRFLIEPGEGGRPADTGDPFADFNLEGGD